MELRLPVSGLVLRYLNANIRALIDELAANDRTLDDLWKDPFLSAARLVQVGRAWEQAITVQEGDAIVDREKAGGVNFNEMVNAMGKAFWGNRAPRLKIHPAIEEEPEAAAEDGTAPKKSDYQPAALVRVS